jgi:hypothetical protein
MTNIGSWIFRILVLLAAGLLLYSWFQPWWGIDVFELVDKAVVIHPYGLEHKLGGNYQLISESDMPVWFTPLMWAYLAVAMLALSVGIFIKDKHFHIGKIKFNLPSFIIGLTGLSYIVVVIAAFVVASMKVAEFGIPLVGDGYIDFGGFMVSGSHQSLQLGYWLACAAGPLLLILAVLRRKIVGNNNS